jgi:hypothetical protein
MIPSFKGRGTILLSIIGALSIIVAAFVLRDTTYEDAWLYITAVWIVFIPACELYTFTKDK